MIRKILNFFGYEIFYEHAGKLYLTRYDSVDLAAMRPIHKNMSVAPPWAKQLIVRVK